MPELNEFNPNDITISESDKKFGSAVKEKREPLRVLIEEVDLEKWKQNFPNKNIDGISYLKVAVDPISGSYGGYIEVDKENDNFIPDIEVIEEYQRRGVAGQLIKQAQLDFDHLWLTNAAGEVGKSFYEKMGFKIIDDIDNFAWRKD